MKLSRNRGEAACPAAGGAAASGRQTIRESIQAMRALLLRVAAALPLLAPVLPAQAIPALYVFGDSLSDEGNLSALTGGAIPVAPTYNGGRFSNGPTWASQFSQTLGLGPSVPSRVPGLGGTNFAHGLARSDDVPTTLPLPSTAINLPDQVAAYVAGPNAPAGALFAVWAGANNMLQALAAAPGQGVNAPAFLAAEVQKAVTGVLSGLQALRLDGATEFLVLNLPDLGLVPRFALDPNPAVAATATLVSQSFNAGLAQGLALFDSIPGVNLRTVDIFGLFRDVVANPGPSGLTNLSTPCVTGPVPEIYFIAAAATNACSPADAATRLFWDPIHPTTAGHAIIAAAAMSAVPAPAAAGLLVVAVLGLVAVRRRA
jgi:phospholipase/lecithinase/hemolysin